MCHKYDISVVIFDIGCCTVLCDISDVLCGISGLPCAISVVLCAISVELFEVLYTIPDA